MFLLSTGRMKAVGYAAQTGFSLGGRSGLVVSVRPSPLAIVLVEPEHRCMVQVEEVASGSQLAIGFREAPDCAVDVGAWRERGARWRGRMA